MTNEQRLAEIKERLESCSWLDNSDEGVGRTWKHLFVNGLHNEHASLCAQAPNDMKWMLSLFTPSVQPETQGLVEALQNLIAAERSLMPTCPIVTHHKPDCVYCAIIEKRIDAEQALSTYQQAHKSVQGF